MRFLQLRAHNRLFVVIALVGAALACRPGTSDFRPPLSFSPDKLPDAQAGQPYDVTITVSGNQTPVFEFIVDNDDLPKGLVLHFESGNTAKVSGIPFDKGEYEFTIKVSCFGTSVNGQTGEHQYRLFVK